MMKHLSRRPWAKWNTWTPCTLYASSALLAVAGLLVARGGRP